MDHIICLSMWTEITYLLRMNKYYRDAKSTNVLKITDKFMDDDQAKASAYQTGEINILQGAPSEIAESYEGKDDLSIREVPQTNYILFNINEKPFDDVKVRQAFSLALNRKDIAQSLVRLASRGPVSLARITRAKPMARNGAKHREIC